MISNVKLECPIIFFDLETTGLSVTNDRIVEISATKFFPDGTSKIKTRRFNPTIPIPAEATAVHGISDEDIKDTPDFLKFAKSISDFFTGCDVGGYNCIRYDIPLLVEEFLRAGAPLPFDQNTRVVDAQKLFHHFEKRDLTAAYKFYCNKNHEGAHGAEKDVQASAEVFNAQIERYGIENNIEAIHALCNENKSTIDYDNKFTRNADGNIVFNFGDLRGQPVHSEPKFLKWMLKHDFTSHTKHCINQILEGKLS